MKILFLLTVIAVGVGMLLTVLSGKRKRTGRAGNRQGLVPADRTTASSPPAKITRSLARLLDRAAASPDSVVVSKPRPLVVPPAVLSPPAKTAPPLAHPPDRTTLPPDPVVVLRHRLPVAPPSVVLPADPWIPAGTTVTVGGYHIPGGLIYVSTQLRNAGGQSGSTEPALINPNLPVAQSHPDYAGTSMSYWPSYEGITPEARAAYLDWLAGGRRAQSVYIGYVFLFFYGLERRLLVDAKQSIAARAEAPALLAEVERLLELYGDNRSFHHYATALLDAARLSLNLLPTPLVPPTPPREGDFPLTLKLALLRYVSRQQPIPPDWALAWLEFHSETRLGTPARRCRETFEQLFRLRYRERFGEGLRVKPNKTRLQMSYLPASLSLPRPLTISVGSLPDITALQAPVKQLRTVAEACLEELTPYSRALGRLATGEVPTLPLLALLPGDLLQALREPALVALTDWLQQVMTDQARCTVAAAELLHRWSPAAAAKLAKSDAANLATLLGKFGYGLEPDVRFGGPVPPPAGQVILFRLDDASPTTPSNSYTAATLLLQLAVAVAAADGTISPAEEMHLQRHLETALELTPAEHCRLLAHLDWLLLAPPGLTGLKKRLTVLTPLQRTTIAHFLVTVAGADGNLDPAEIRLLTKVYTLLGLEPDSVYSHLHAATSGPVTIRPADAGPTGYAIPSPAVAQTAAKVGEFSLDMAAVARTLRETHEVQAVLASIFSEEPAPALLEPVSDTATVAGLDAAHSTLLRQIATRDCWPRDQFDDLCAKLGLLPDGAVETLNEAAFERLGEPLLEGDDSLEVNAAATQEMLS